MTVDQATFGQAVLSPEAQRPSGLSDGAGRPAGRRFDVYRNNVAVSLTEALETAFPVIRKLVGDSNFKLLAGTFFRKHPPMSPLMMFYGDEMPSFLETFEPTQSLGYLPDVARLELALRQSYHAADHDPIDPTDLQVLSPDMLMASNLHLAPSLRVVRSNWPIYAIWRFNMDDGPKPAATAEDVVVLRANMDPKPVLLPPGAGSFLTAITSGKPLGEAFEAAINEVPTFDLSATLALLLGSNSIAKTGDLT
ncbi:MAG: DNA-binding domain-containing protein [Pseudomonadota bacterium]